MDEPGSLFLSLGHARRETVSSNPLLLGRVRPPSVEAVKPSVEMPMSNKPGAGVIGRHVRNALARLTHVPAPASAN